MSCIIIGASHAGVQAAVNLRSQGYEGKITLISSDAVLPYHRPPLSKAFLQNTLPEQRLWLRPEAFYQQKDINLLLGKRVEKIDRQQKHVTLNDQQCLPYDKLILATGASIRRLTVPGSQLAGIHYLRDYQDTVGIRDSLEHVNNVVVIGGGYIGLEAAASLNKLGKNVVLLLKNDRPLSHITSDVVSDYLSKIHTQHGVEIKTNSVVEKIVGNNSVTSVLTTDGIQYQADMVIVGIGVMPEQQLAQQCGLDVNNGIMVNEYMQSSDHNIFAIGDCANFYHPVYQKKLRIESVQNATDQSKTAALAICGQLIPYTSTAWFWSDQYDDKLQIAGLSDGYDETIVRHEKDNSLAVFYMKNNQLIAIDTINQPKSFMVTRKHIHKLPIVDKVILADPNQDINNAFIEKSGV